MHWATLWLTRRYYSWNLNNLANDIEEDIRKNQCSVIRLLHIEGLKPIIVYLTIKLLYENSCLYYYCISIVLYIVLWPLNKIVEIPIMESLVSNISPSSIYIVLSVIFFSSVVSARYVPKKLTLELKQCSDNCG